MDPAWFALNVSVVSSGAQFTLAVTLLGYLLSLPTKSLEARLFAGYFLLGCLFYTVDVIHNLVVVYPSFYWYTTAISNIILGVMHLFFVGFAYQCGGNPYKRESVVALLTLGLMLFMPLLLFDLGTRHITSGLAHLTGVTWIVGVYGRKANRIVEEAGRSTPVSKMLRDFQRWAILNLLIWVVATYNPLAMILGFPLFTLWYYVVHPLIFIQITYAVIVFLNYTPQRTSFQAKIVGLVLCPLLIILALTPFLLRSLIVDLPNFEQVNHQVVVAFLILIPIITLAVIVGLPRFLRSNLLSPLHQIMEGVRQVDAGNLAVRVPVTVNDEVGMLAHQFNRMTDSLHLYSNQMEALVAERTTQLQQSLDTLKAAQAQLIQQEKMASLGELTAGIAHEIQNPLNFVNNFAEVSAELAGELQESAQAGDIPGTAALAADLRQNMQHIARNGQRASSIVRSMLEHSRSSTVERRPTNLNELAGEYLRLAYHGMRNSEGRTPGDAAQDFQVELHTNWDEELPLVQIAPQDIGRVLLNLYNNAFYAVREKQRQVHTAVVAGDGEDATTSYQPQVWVSTRLVKDQSDRLVVELRVRDNGPGIPEGIHDKIFQPFFTTKPTGEGTGLGLSLSYETITKGHGGEMRVVSAVGEGSEFYVTIPLNPPNHEV
jgi:two-component system, NtrC family, sensor kinase